MAGITMKATQADGFYFPPEWDPSQGSLDAYRRRQGFEHHLGKDRVKNLHKGILQIRFEMPFKIQCLNCKEHIGQGSRFDADKKKVGNYYTTPIYSFSMRCGQIVHPKISVDNKTHCNNLWVIETDPQNVDYKMVQGCVRAGGESGQRASKGDIESVVAGEAEGDSGLNPAYLDMGVKRRMESDPLFRLEVMAKLEGGRGLEELAERRDEREEREERRRERSRGRGGKRVAADSRNRRSRDVPRRRSGRRKDSRSSSGGLREDSRERELPRRDRDQFGGAASSSSAFVGPRNRGEEAELPPSSKRDNASSHDPPKRRSDHSEERNKLPKKARAPRRAEDEDGSADRLDPSPRQDPPPPPPTKTAKRPADAAPQPPKQEDPAPRPPPKKNPYLIYPEDEPPEDPDLRNEQLLPPKQRREIKERRLQNLINLEASRNKRDYDANAVLRKSHRDQKKADAEALKNNPNLGFKKLDSKPEDAEAFYDTGKVSSKKSSKAEDRLVFEQKLKRQHLHSEGIFDGSGTKKNKAVGGVAPGASLQRSLRGTGSGKLGNMEEKYAFFKACQSQAKRDRG